MIEIGENLKEALHAMEPYMNTGFILSGIFFVMIFIFIVAMFIWFTREWRGRR